MISVVQEPDVSFVIAAYNAEDTLESAIDSALAQVGVSMEVIVVDDCSSDGTRELALRCRDRDDRVKLIVQPANGGPAAARNAGFDAATGRWIAVLDADDTIHPQRLKRMIARAEAMDARIVVDNIDVVPLEGGQPTAMFSRSDLEARNTLELADFIESNIIFESTFNFGYMKPIFRRDFLNQHGLRFDENLRIGEDYILLASAIASISRRCLPATRSSLSASLSSRGQ
jgi:succinoglycan biosynthesis protein ExoO